MQERLCEKVCGLLYPLNIDIDSGLSVPTYGARVVGIFILG